MTTAQETTWNTGGANASNGGSGNSGNAGGGNGGGSGILNRVTGTNNGGNPSNNNNNNNSNSGGNNPSTSTNGGTGVAMTNGGRAQTSDGGRVERDGWRLGGLQFSTSREVYTRSLFRLCLKFTTSEDEDEGKPEAATAFWTLFGRPTSIGNGGPSSQTPDDIVRRMDDSMTGPGAGVLSRLVDTDGDQAAVYALRSGLTTGWHIRGDRGDAAVRVGKAKVFTASQSGDNTRREAQILSLDADRWALVKGASFAAGNSVFNVEDSNENKQRITIHCSKGPMRGKLIDIPASRCPFVFGRAHEADLCIMDRELSRRHGAILYIPTSNNSSNNRNGRGKGKSTGIFILTDLESTVRCLLVSERACSFFACGAPDYHSLFY